MTGHIVNVWDLIADPDVPSDVVQRAFGRTRARALGIPPAPIPDEDLPHLARHAAKRPGPGERPMGGLQGDTHTPRSVSPNGGFRPNRGVRDLEDVQDHALGKGV